MSTARPLTKSKFKVGAQCPTKLYYLAHREYANKNDQDEFLKALADGGFQVGELAKLYYPQGVLVETLDSTLAVQLTEDLLKQENVTIFEAALAFENLLVRVDVLEKRGNQINLIEVKAKSFHPDQDTFANVFNANQLKKGIYQLKEDWGEYLLDLAYQTYVAQKSYPKFEVQPHLMLVDKSKVSSVDGLNQLFLIQRLSNGRTKVAKTREVGAAELGQQLLTAINLKQQVDLILSKATLDYGPSFSELVQNLSHWQANGEICPPIPGPQCKTCEFRVQVTDSKTRSGFDQCWQTAYKLTEDELKKPFVFDVWDFRKTAEMLESQTLFAQDLNEDQVGLKAREEPSLGLSRTERQMQQIYATRDADPQVYIETDLLAAELKKLPPPYHFIDFETTMVAIPFHKGRKPYEQVAFQFSHHLLHSDGTLEHRTEYLNAELGHFPNFDFLRALRQALGESGGTVFRFAAHENTVLNQIHKQLADSNESDRDELMAWVESMSTPPSRDKGAWTPTRSFIDMRELIVKYVYLPETNGSNSIKKVLPAALNAGGPTLHQKFAEWIKVDSQGRVQDPYKLLPPIFSDVDPQALERLETRLIEKEALNDGGAAMMAWSRMQFTQMSELEREALKKSLLRYCALDTLAMVMIWEWWQQQIAQAGLAA